MIEVGQYVYPDRPIIATSAAECLAKESYSKTLPANTRPFRVIEALATIVTIDKDGKRNSVPVYCGTVPPALKRTQAEDSRTQNEETYA